MALLTALAAVLRVATLGGESYWIDESVTQGLVSLDLGHVLETVADTESTPPLYYVVAWAWVHVFGTGEVGLRSLSALAGTLTVPVAYLAGRELVSRRAGVVAAALVAVSPELLWYSQEARSYALLGLLSALSLLFFARARRRMSGPDLAAWAVVSALALLTHYFAIFLVAVEAVWLLVSWPRRLMAAGAVLVVVAAQLAVLPLMLHQRAQGHADFIHARGLPSRLLELVGSFVAGQTGQLIRPAVLGLSLLVAAALLLLVTRAEAAERRAARTPALLACAGAAIPLVLAALGSDYFLARNLLPLWLPLALVVAAGLATRSRPRAAAWTLFALVALSLAVDVVVSVDPKLGRERITAELLPPRFDQGRQDVTVRMAFSPVGRGQAGEGLARCPGDHVAMRGFGQLVRAKRLTPGRPAAHGQGWAAAYRQPSGRDTLQVVAVCAPTRGGKDRAPN